MKQVGTFVVGVVLAIAILAWVLHDTDPAQLRSALSRAFVPGIVLAALLNFGHNVFRVWRWRVLLSPVRPAVSFRPMFSAVVIGYLTTWIVPGRLGEAVRPMLLSTKENLPLGPCLGSIVADRLLDGAAIVVLAAVGLLAAPLSGEAAAHAEGIRATAYVLVGVMAVGLGGLMAISGLAGSLEGWLARRARPIRWVGHAVLGLARGTDALRRPSALLSVGVLSLLAWGAIALGTWVGMRASGADVPFGAALTLLPLLALGVAVPTPGGAGGYHGAMKWGLVTLYGVDPETAVAAAILMHLAILVPVLLVGPVLLKVEKVSWEDVLRGARRVRDLGASPAEAGVAS